MFCTFDISRFLQFHSKSSTSFLPCLCRNAEHGDYLQSSIPSFESKANIVHRHVAPVTPAMSQYSNEPLVLIMPPAPCNTRIAN